MKKTWSYIQIVLSAILLAFVYYIFIVTNNFAPAGLKGNRRVADGKKIYGVYKGVRVGVIRTNGKIATIFPDSDQSSVLKKRRK